MAILTGCGGNITFSTFGGVVGRTWSATVSRNKIDATGFGMWQNFYMPGRLAITGSITGAADSETSPFLWAALADTGNTTKIVLEIGAGASSSAGHSISFLGHVDSCDVGVDVGSETADVTFNFSLSDSTTATSFVFSNRATAVWT